MLAINRWCPECHGCRCGSASCPPGTRCKCPSGVRHVPAFGSTPAGTNPAQGRATGGGFVPEGAPWIVPGEAYGDDDASDSRFMNRDDAHDADEDAQPERDAAPGYGPWVKLTLPSGTVVERAAPHDCERNVDDPVASPAHYTAGGIECIDAIEAALTPEEARGYRKGNALKYLWRAGRKGDAAQDIAKAQWYLSREASA